MIELLFEPVFLIRDALQLFSLIVTPIDLRMVRGSAERAGVTLFELPGIAFQLLFHQQMMLLFSQHQLL